MNNLVSALRGRFLGQQLTARASRRYSPGTNCPRECTAAPFARSDGREPNHELLEPELVSFVKAGDEDTCPLGRKARAVDREKSIHRGESGVVIVVGERMV